MLTLWLLLYYEFIVWYHSVQISGHRSRISAWPQRTRRVILQQLRCSTFFRFDGWYLILVDLSSSDLLLFDISHSNYKLINILIIKIVALEFAVLVKQDLPISSIFLKMELLLRPLIHHMRRWKQTIHWHTLLHGWRQSTPHGKFIHFSDIPLSY